MKTTLKSIAKRVLAYLLGWCLAIQPALSANVTVSPTPLATAGGSSVLPNLLFTLDASGSMDWDFLPDYLENEDGGNKQCMTRSDGGTDCRRGDPVWYAGGSSGANGVAYDPRVNYKPGLKYDGTNYITTLTLTSVPNDAYQAQSTSNTDITTGIQDNKFCNANNVCRRNGTTGDNTTLQSGTDGQGNTQTTGRFPYRTHLTNTSTGVMGLPEMMAIGSFTRSGSSVTATTLAPHGLTTSDFVYVRANNNNVDVSCVAVSSVTTASPYTFNYTTGSGTVSATTGNFRKCVSGTWARAGTNTANVTVTSTGHGMVSNDVIFIDSDNNNQDRTTATITVSDANTFTYAATTGTGTGTSGNLKWVRTGLYNVRDQVNGAPIAYTITPVEYCSDKTLTNCVQILPGGAAVSGFTEPAYVRFCQTQEQALAPDAIGDASGTPRCRAKYVGYGASPSWTNARYGWFVRENIVSGAAPFTGRPARSDCVTSGTAPNCTYTEEAQNYARWYTYYRTRMQMMKTASGRAFQPFISGASGSNPPDKLRVGFITINPEYTNASNPSNQGSVQTSRYLKVSEFRGGTTGHAKSWYDKFYQQIPAQGTPLREALSRAGWIFAGKMNSGLTDGIPAADDPVLASCQRHFTLLTTDGYWNGNGGKDLANGSIGNADNVNPTTDLPYTSVSVDRTTTGTFDGGIGTTVTTTTPTTQVRQVACQGNNQTTFGGSGGQTACGCPLDMHRIMERTTTTNSSTTTVDGAASGGTTTTSSETFAPAAGAAGVCSLGATWTKSTQPADVVTAIECDKRSGPNPVTFPDGSQKSCSFCDGSSNSSDRRVVIRQTLRYNKVSYTADGAVTGTNILQVPSPAPTPTYAWARSTNTPINWVTTEPTNSGGCNDNNLSSLEGQTTTNVGSASNTNGTGTTLTLMSPNPSAGVAGTPTTSSVAGGYPDTLADVAMYYFRTDLRGGNDFKGNATGPANNASSVNVSANNVPARAGAKNFATHQHMVTFTVGLIDGLMRYQADYDTATDGDFASIKAGSNNACFWVNGTCNWPQPVNDTPAALDDLWHAAVNGRGQYYLANNVDALASGLQNTLTALNAQVAAAAASATSSPNVTQTDNQIFSTTYETNTWAGRVFAQTIDPATGNVDPTIQWQADALLLGKVSATSDTRTLYTWATTGNKVKAFDWASLDATEKSFFTNKCPSALPSNCGSLSTGPGGQQATVNVGDVLVGYLRGQIGNEASLGSTSPFFRDRTFLDPNNNNAVVQTVMGDTISAKPAYVRAPTFNYGGTYTTFSANNANRSPRVYVGANDGFLHAFNGNTGVEEWAYTPRFLMSGLWVLADKLYSHTYFVDGSPETADVLDEVTTPGTPVWKTILVGGSGGGGAGFYALDITDPSSPKGLWEFCSKATECAISNVDLGLSFGNPVIGKRSFDGKWVVIVTSGLNNNVETGSTGLGKYFILDAITGAVLNTVSTGVGDTTTPAGLMKSSAFFTSALTDATFQYVYSGDQLGNVWRLDVGSATPTVTKITTLLDNSATPRAQPISTRPTLTHIGTDRILYVGTGRYLGTPDLTDQGAGKPSWQQTLYAFKDKTYAAGSGLHAGLANLRLNTSMVQRSFTQVSPTERGISTSPVVTMDWATNDGWFIDFNPSFGSPTPVPNSPGEGVNLVDPRLILGTLAVTTNVPAIGGSMCSVGGSSFFYNFDFRTGLPVSSSPNGVVGVSLGGTITVGVAIVQLPNGAIKSISTGADTSKTTTDVKTAATGTSVKPFSYRVR